MALRGSPSVMFDAVIIVSGPAGDKALAANPDAVSFLMDACRHLKAIGLSGAPALAAKAGIAAQVGIVEVVSSKDIPSFIEFARSGKVWERESTEVPSPAIKKRNK